MGVAFVTAVFATAQLLSPKLLFLPRVIFHPESKIFFSFGSPQSGPEPSRCTRSMCPIEADSETHLSSLFLFLPRQAVVEGKRVGHVSASTRTWALTKLQNRVNGEPASLPTIFLLQDRCGGLEIYVYVVIGLRCPWSHLQASTSPDRWPKRGRSCAEKRRI